MERRNKKFHSWKAKHKRKKRNLARLNGHGTLWHNAPKDYCKDFWKSYRQREKACLYKVFMEYDERYIQFQFNHRHSATWDYW